jgi:hypothetical protein
MVLLFALFVLPAFVGGSVALSAVLGSRGVWCRSIPEDFALLGRLFLPPWVPPA